MEIMILYLWIWEIIIPVMFSVMTIAGAAGIMFAIRDLLKKTKREKAIWK